MDLQKMIRMNKLQRLLWPVYIRQARAMVKFKPVIGRAYRKSEYNALMAAYNECLQEQKQQENQWN